MELPPWAERLKDQYVGGQVMFVLHGNVEDLVVDARGGGDAYVDLPAFLDQVLFRPRKVVLHFRPGRGLSWREEGSLELLKRTVQASEEAAGASPARVELPSDAAGALRLIERALPEALRGAPGTPGSAAVVIHHADLVVGRDTFTQADRAATGRLLSWASDPLHRLSDVTFLLLTQALEDLPRPFTRSPHVGRIQLPPPGQPERARFLAQRLATYPDLQPLLTLPIEELARRTEGATLVALDHLLTLARVTTRQLTPELLARVPTART